MASIRSFDGFDGFALQRLNLRGVVVKTRTQAERRRASITQIDFMAHLQIALEMQAQ